jgi:hypothetical protein
MKVQTRWKMLCLSGIVYWYNRRVESIQHDNDLMSLALIHTSIELPKFYSFRNFKLCDSLRGNLSVHNYIGLSSILSQLTENTFIWVNQYAWYN